jgi:predicted restriction endonuclease
VLNRVVAAGHRKLWERIEQVVALTWPGKTIDQLLAERNVASPPPDSRDEPVVPAEAPLQRRTPRRKARTALSFERDRSIADEVKEQEQYSCQVCGRTLVNARTQEPYAESHHVHPLGHGGSDATDNMLCLCPLCHALFHLGCIGIDCLLRIHVSGVATEERLFQRLRLASGRHISIEALRHHWGALFIPPSDVRFDEQDLDEDSGQLHDPPP